MREHRRVQWILAVTWTVLATVGCHPEGYHSIDFPESELAKLKAERDNLPGMPGTAKSIKPGARPDRGGASRGR
jgi:hypothetical protein